MNWKIEFSRTALKDAKKLKAANLEENLKSLLKILKQNPYEPPYEKLSGNLKGYYSRRIHPEGSAIVSLRLIGFPGGAELDHTQPLTLTTSLGQNLTARDISSEISQNTPTPANVGEYDIKFALSQLQAEIPLQLTLPTIDGESVSLSVPSSAIQEWQTVAASHE